MSADNYPMFGPGHCKVCGQTHYVGDCPPRPPARLPKSITKAKPRKLIEVLPMSADPIKEAHALVDPYIAGAKYVRIRVVTLRGVLFALQAAERTLAEYRKSLDVTEEACRAEERERVLRRALDLTPAALKHLDELDPMATTKTILRIVDDALALNPETSHEA